MASGRLSVGRLGRVLAAVALVAVAMVGISVLPADAALGISGTVGPPSSTRFGKSVTFTGTINNTGSGAAENFTGVTIVDDGSVGLNVAPVAALGPLTAPGSAPFSVSAVISGAPGTTAQLHLKATGVTASAADTDPQADVDGASFTVDDAVVLSVAAESKQGAGAFTPCAGSCDVGIGDGIRYTVTVTNQSDVGVTDVKITAAAPPGTTSVSSTIPAGSIVLGAGASQSFVREVTVNAPASPGGPPHNGDVINFSATATYDTTLPLALNDEFAGAPAPFASTVSVGPSVSLSITATPAVGTPVPRNTDITYVISASNGAGLANATNVVISFPIPEETTFVSAAASAGGSAPTGGPGRPITTTFATLVSGGPASTLTVQVHVVANPTKDPGVTPANDIDATASATYGPGSNVANAAVAHEISAVDLTLSISPSSQSIQKKKAADVTVTVGNNPGPDPATGVKTVTVNLTGVGLIQSATGCTINAATQAVCTISAPIAPGGNVTFPLKVSADAPGTATLTASLSTTGAEIDENAANNADVVATVNFQQSASDLSITASSPVALVFGGPTQNVTFTLSVADPNPAPNGNDPAEGVQVSIAIPADVQATAAAFTGAQTGSCTVPGGSGGTASCTIGDINNGGVVTITVALQGTTLLAVAAPVTATATTTNDDPTTPSAASVLVTVVPQPVDLAVNDVADRIITTSGPADPSEAGSFTITVSNNSAAFSAGSYTLTVDLPAGLPTDVALSSADPACSVVANVVTCNGTNLVSGTPKSFVVSANIQVPGPVTVRSRVALTTLTQIDAAVGNNSDTFTVTRNLPPDAKADVGPTIPAGATLVFDVLNNDTDGDAADIPNLAVQLPVTGAAGLAVTVEAKKLKIVSNVAEPAATLDLAYSVIDGRGGSTPTTLKVRVTGPIVETRDGTFGQPPPAPLPQSFGTELDPARIGPAPTAIDVLKDALGKDANDAVFSGTSSYDLTSVDQNTINVAGSTATPGTGDPPVAHKVVRYTPAAGYTSDALSRTPTNLVKAPPDSFKYKATGTRSGAELFTVESTATIEVRNQLPIGLDSLVEIFTASPSGVIEPAGNDLDGNTVADPIVVKSGGSFVFDDEGKKDPAHGLQIACIGPVPTLDPVSGQPPVPGAGVCDEPGMKKPVPIMPLTNPIRYEEQELEVAAPINPDTGKSPGNIKATLVGNTAAGVTPFKTVKVSIDATVVGIVPFVAVVVDNYGGSAFSLVNISIPNQPPVVIPGVQRVPENSPPVKVLDTTLPGVAKDNNGDLVKVSSVTDPAHGTATITSDAFGITYQPDKDYVGPDSLVLNVSDNRGVGSNSAQMTIDVFKAVDPLAPAGTGATGAGGSNPAGTLAKTGGDPVPLTVAACFSMLLGYGLVQVSRRRRSLPLLDGARHLRA